MNKLEEIKINPHKLSKQDLIKFFVGRCVHRHNYNCHPACFVKENQYPIKTGYLDIECVLPDTLILTSTGLKEIKDIEVGERVLTHKNRWQKVIKIFSRDIDDDVISLSDNKCIPLITTTLNHPFYTSTNDGYYGKYTYMLNFLTEPRWLKAGQLTTKNLTLGIKNEEAWKDIKYIYIGPKPSQDKHNTSNIPSKIIVDDDFLFVLGFFLGDGSATSGSSIQFFPNIKDKEAIKIIRRWAVKIGAKNIHISKEGSMFNIRICSGRLYNFFRKFYNEKKEKHFPLDWLNLPTDRFMKIIQGLIAADGCDSKRSKRIINTSIVLLQQICIRLSLSSFYHVTACKGSDSKNRFKNKEGKIYNCKDVYDLSLNGDSKKKRINQSNFLDYIIRRIVYLKRKNYKGKVYNLHVENDNSYITNGYITHNCNGIFPAFSILGSYAIKEDGTNKIYGRYITAKEIRSDTLDKQLLEECITDMLKFDRLITYFGTYYDITFLRTLALTYGIKDFPLYGTVKHIDVYFMVKSKLKLHRRSLEEAARALEIKGKTHVEGKLWKRAFLHADEKLLKKIFEHNKQDVIVLEKVFKKLQGYCLEPKRSL